MSALQPHFPTYLHDHKDYVRVDDVLGEALNDAFKLIDDPKCKRVAISLINVFRRDHFFINLKIAVDDIKENQKKYYKNDVLI